MAKQRKALISALKIAISAVLIYFIFTKVDFSEVFDILRTTNPFYFLLALLFLSFQKLSRLFGLTCISIN
ncbi:hypothetical protein [Maribacter halichondriae]|uniref:hypothetical protein n=1 Tax=Maribacter halichondriae TaxID=2980554 RepID=UPI003D31423F